MVVLLPDVKELASNLEWGKVESRIVQHSNKNVTPFEERRRSTFLAGGPILAVNRSRFPALCKRYPPRHIKSH